MIKDVRWCRLFEVDEATQLPQLRDFVVVSARSTVLSRKSIPFERHHSHSFFALHSCIALLAINQFLEALFPGSVSYTSM